jgi:ribosomal protein S18 acetylase RimI-like enzyme
MAKVRKYEPRDESHIIRLIAEFRLALGNLKQSGVVFNDDMARQELHDYLNRHFPVFVAEDDRHELLGYLVCRVDEDVVWADSLCVSSRARRKGIGSSLYSEAERLAESLGGDTVYNWVHPNNHVIISFLQKRGYDVLNLIEIRRPRKGERPAAKVRVSDHEFSY